MKSKKICLLFSISAMVMVVLSLGLSSPVYAGGPGTDSNGVGNVDVHGSIDPVVTETGYISLSVDGLGTVDPSGGTIQVDKPSGATVRSAYFAAASTGFTYSQIANGDVTIDGSGVNWDNSLANAIFSYNYWANVTSMVKPKIDAAPAGLIDFAINENNTYDIDGEILAVIFNDPNQTVSNTIVLLFGAQDVAGDTFNIGLAQPLNKADPKLGLDFSLGISYSYQSPGDPDPQYSIVNVNGSRLTTSAGGQDDCQGDDENGSLLTVGGIGDSNTNPPDPNALPNGDPRYDDELYNLLPFVHTGDTNISVFTQNPSTDDNIFFAALFLRSVTAQVNAPVLKFTKTVVLAKDADGDGVPSPGDTLKYTCVIKNTGNIAATGVDFSDIPDPHTTLLNGTVTKTQGIILKGNHIGDKTVEVAIGTIAAGAKATITFEVTINNLWVPVVSNQALTRGTNFAFVLSDDPNTAQPNDPTRLRVQTSPGVPGISGWGIGVLVLLFGGTMIWIMRRNRIWRNTR